MKLKTGGCSQNQHIFILSLKGKEGIFTNSQDHLIFKKGLFQTFCCIQGMPSAHILHCYSSHCLDEQYAKVTQLQL